MAEKKVKVKVDVETNAAGSIAELKELKKQLKETAAGSADFKRLANEIDDLEDKIKGAKQGSADWIDTLASAGGPVGALGSALNKAKVATVSFGTALKATGIGLIVAAVGGLVAAFNNVEGAGKKLEPLMIGLEKILGGIMEVMSPLIDAFMDLALKALPYITKYIANFYSGLVSLFTLVKEAGVGVGKILKGIFTLDFDDVKAGWEQLTGSWDKAVTTFKSSMVAFEAGTKKLTKTQKENLKEAAEAAKKAAEEAKRLKEEELKTLAAGQEEAMKTLLADKEREEYEVQKKYANLIWLATKYGEDTKQLKEAQAKELAAIQKKYDDEEAKKKKEKDDKAAEEARGIKATELQAEFEALDKKSKLHELDFEQDLQRIQEQRDILAQQEANDLSNTNLTEFQKTEIRKKYADARIALTDLEIQTEKAAVQAKHDINMAYLQLFEQFGNLLSQVAGKNKALAIAGIVISQAAAIGQIIASTGMANAKAVSASPLTFGQPWVAINTISAALSIASTIASAVKSIQQINQAASQAGVTGGGGSGASVGAAPSIAAPKVGGASAPQINVGGGSNPTAQLAQTINAARAPIKTYVLQQDVSTATALARRTNRAATFSSS